MDNKKVIVCDLDGTLTPSRASLSRDMAEVLCHILSRHFLAVISGADYSQFQKQFLSQLHCNEGLLRNLSLFPTMGSTCYTYDSSKGNWKQLYREKLNDKEREEVIKSLKESIQESGFDLSGAYGDIIEDRQSQITFSGRGQKAPIDVKERWDPDQSKRRFLVNLLKKKIPQFEIRIGGMTSIDITRKGIDKAYAIEKIKNLLKVRDNDIIFIGDALYKGGNDESVKESGVDFIQESGPNETLELLSRYM